MKFLYNEYETRKDRYFLINYNGEQMRLVHIRNCKLSGFELKNKKEFTDLNSFEVARVSLSRTKKNLREIALANNFEFFATITINSKNADRYNLTEAQEKLKKTLKKIKRKNSELLYFFITEKHKNGAFHFHGLVKGIDDLYENENGYLSSRIFSTELGYNSFSKIRDYSKTCNYILKYITKDCIKNTHNQIYISSKGLKKAEKTEIKPIIFSPSYKNDYVSLLDFSVSKLTQEELLKFMNISDKGGFFNG